MGTPSKMAAYRQHKETPVPWDIDQRNDQSKRRNELVQRVEQGSPAGETQVPDSVREVVSSPGQSLDPSVKRTMEDRMGEDFSDVQVHTGPKAAQAAESINARAFTVGNHVAFNRGEYDPGSADGQHVIAHELAHVRQQTGGAVSMLPQDDVGLEIDPDPKLEREAEETAQRVMQGSELGIQRLGKTDIHIQRNSYRRQKRQEDGKFGELKEEYSYSAPDNLEKLRNDRPPLPKSVVKEVWNRAKNANGDVICPVDKVKLDWDGENRKGQWVMGHKPRREYRVLVDYLLSGTISYDTFMQEYKNPDHYRPESPQASRRGEHEGRGQYWKEKFGPINTPDADGGIS